MELGRVLALRGPNVWASFQVLEAWVHLQNFKDVDSSELPGFNDRLRAFLPSLIEHRCSVGERGGFYQRLERGTYLAHILEHVVIELQCLSGSEVGYGKTRMTHTDGLYRVAVEYLDEDLGRACFEVGLRLCLAAIHDTAFDVEAELIPLREILKKNALPAITQAIMNAARKSKIPAKLLDPSGLVQLGYGAKQHRVFGLQTDGNSGVGNSIAYDRELTRLFLQSVGVPIPSGRAVNSVEEACSAALEMGLPIVLRPRYVNGRGSVLGPLSSQVAIEAAFARINTDGGWSCIVEQHIPGEAYLVLVVGNQVVSVSKPLTDQNEFPRTHPSICDRAIDAVRSLNLDVAGVEIVVQDLSRPLESQHGCIVGIHSQPELMTDAEPAGKAIVAQLYPEPCQSRIPIVSVSGVNGKTTTTRLTAHLLSQRFHSVGMCCTEGVYVGTRRIMTGDCSGPKSARVVLQHPRVDAAVLEVARGGILREGLGYDRSDVAIITNIGAGDHLGCGDIETTDQLASVKSTLVWAVATYGYAVLNAADALVVSMACHCDGKIIYFARKATNPVILEHRNTGGRAIFTRDNQIILAEGTQEVVLMPLERVPLTHAGRVGFHVENALASAAAAWGLGLSYDEIRRGLETFRTGLDTIPARFNLLDINGLTVVFDYGHNTSALASLIEVLEHFPHARRTIVYSAAGDRRDQDIIDQGIQLGDAFDRVFLYEDTCMRGRQEGEIARLFRLGMDGRKRIKEIHEVRSSMLVIEKALESCVPGDLLIVQPDLIDDGVALLKKFLERGGREITLNEAIRHPSTTPGVDPMSGVNLEIKANRLGRGIYAKCDFAAGELLLSQWGPTTSVRSIYTIQVDHDLHLIPPEPLRYINHSCEPNCGILIRSGIESVEVYSLRPIQAGEELTYDYETFELEFAALTGPCLCQTSSCRGQLSGYKDMAQDLREAYGKYVAEYLRESDLPLTINVPEKVG